MSASTENGDDNGYVTGGSLRSIFRAEIQSVLKPPKEAARLAEIEESVKQLMAKVTTKKSKPSASSFKPPPRATQSARERPPTRDMGVQEESWQEPSADAQKSFLEVLERPVTDAPPEPEKPPPELLIKNCVYEEVNAADLRETVREARKKLFTLDTETTRLNRELKECRMETWRHQRNVAHIQSSTSKLIDEHRSALPAPQLEEELALEREDSVLAQLWTFVLLPPMSSALLGSAIDLDVKDPLSPDAYFSESYAEARDKFRRAAEVLGRSVAVRLETLLVKEPDYIIDIAVVPGSSGRGLVVHSSGVHGVEGFAGSAIQTAVLHEMHCSGQLPQVTCVFIHAVNPYGMAHFRRWNENNVDLNRNALTPEGWQEVKSRDPNIAGYEDFKDLLIPTSAPTCWFSHIGIWLTSLRLIVQYGSRHLKRALVSATYKNSAGIFFGGEELQPSHVLLTRFMQDNFGKVPSSEVSWIDVHTGLGPKGVDVLLYDGGQDKGTIQQSFPGADVQGLEDAGNASGSAAAGYELARGLVTSYYHTVFKKSTQPAFLATQEFGTVPPILVSRSLILENAGYQFDRANHEHWRTYTRDAFYVREPEWKAAIIKRGMTVFHQLVDLCIQRSAK